MIIKIHYLCKMKEIRESKLGQWISSDYSMRIFGDTISSFGHDRFLVLITEIMHTDTLLND